MLGQNSNDRLLATDYFISGSLSGFVSRIVVQPLDVLKTRLQLQVEPIKACKTSKYHGIFQAVRCIKQEEGVFAFWKGHVPAQLQAVTFSGFQFMSFQVLVSCILKFNTFPGFEFILLASPYATNTFGNFLCGCGAGAFAAVMTQPLDVLRTRFIAQGEPKIYKNITQALICMASREGIQGFFRGLVPSLLLISPQIGVQFATYHASNRLIDRIRDRWKQVNDLEQISNSSQSYGTIQSMVSGGLAGMSSKFIIYPLDIAKKRIQMKGFEEARKCFGHPPNSNGLRDCLFSIWYKEGSTALFKGLKPTLIKAFVSVSCRFTLYEEVCRLLIHYRDPKFSKIQ